MRPAYGESFANKLEQLYNALERINCKVILLDGIHLISVDSAQQQRLLVNMSSILQLSFIVAGTLEANLERRPRLLKYHFR